MDENDFSGVNSISEHIELYFKIKNTPKKNSQKADRKRGRGGLNAYGQPDRKISVFFGDFPYCQSETTMLQKNLTGHRMHVEGPQIYQVNKINSFQNETDRTWTHIYVVHVPFVSKLSDEK